VEGKTLACCLGLGLLRYRVMVLKALSYGVIGIRRMGLEFMDLGLMGL